jgi:hypothetical protein
MAAINYTPSQNMPMSGQMMDPSATPAQSVGNLSAVGGMPSGLSPEALMKMGSMMRGNTGDPLAGSYGVAGGASNAGPMGMNTMQALGGGGNPLNLSSGTSFSPSDLNSLRNAFSLGG